VVKGIIVTHLDSQPMVFSNVLMLIVGLTLPVINDKGMEKNALNLLAGFTLSSINDKCVHGTSMVDIVFQPEY